MVNDLVFMLICLYLPLKALKVCIKTKLTSATLLHKAQVTKHSTGKRTIVTLNARSIATGQTFWFVFDYVSTYFNDRSHTRKVFEET